MTDTEKRFLEMIQWEFPNVSESLRMRAAAIIRQDAEQQRQEAELLFSRRSAVLANLQRRLDAALERTQGTFQAVEGGRI